MEVFNSKFEKETLGLEIHKQIFEICSPIFKIFDIVFFRYLKVFSNGSRINLCTDPNWTENFYSKGYYNIAWYDARKFEGKKTVQILWDEKSLNDDNVVGIEFRKNFNFFHGMSIIHPNKEYYEVFDFATKKENMKINESYLSNREIFEHFIFYFRDKANVLIKTQEKNKIKLKDLLERWRKEDSLNKIQKMKKLDFLEEMNIKKFYVNTSLGDIYFTKREAECIYWLALGKSSEEIGLILKSSKKTVENQINAIKNKIGCRKTSNIIELGFKSNLLEVISLGINNFN